MYILYNLSKNFMKFKNFKFSYLRQCCNNESLVYILADSGFFKNFLYQGGVKSTVFWVLEDLKFKISEGYD